ncbi:MAG: VPS10 domain-containing protein [Longimicrobiales bacterium]
MSSNARNGARILGLLCVPLLAVPTGVMAQDADPFSALEWTNIGPDRGGRSIAVAGSDARPLEYYFGATGGGLWKTTDAGTTWEPVTDGQINSASVGSIAVCPANPDVVYIGTGETQLRGNIQAGDGLYKSTDAGETWEHIGLRDTRNFSRVRVHPTDCNTVFAGGFGEYGTENEERGVYRSRDGGATWEKVLYRDAKTGAVDISIDPNNPNVIYAALWDAFRKPWAMSSGGDGSGLFKSTDGGSTWTELTRNPGLPPSDQIIGKIGVSVSAADPNRVYAIVEADSGGVFRSDDAGATWERMNTERKLRQRAFYYTRIYADPVDVDRVYVVNVQFFRSDDGGKTFDTQIRVPHGDNHDLWIASNDNQRMINANDGGGNVSFNGGRTWTDQDYPTAQLYRIGVTAHEPYHVCGGQQDNSTVCVPSQGWDHLAATEQFFYAPGGCESGYVSNDPEAVNIFYAGCYGGALDRFDYATGQERPVNVWPENPMGWSAKDLKERVQWTFPIVFSRSGPKALYTTSQHVWKSTNEGQSWERISPDLTRAEPSTMEANGGPITKDQTGVETYPTVFALATSPHDPNVLWAGTDDGIVQVTRDGGANWQEVTPPDLPEFTKIFTVEISPHVPSRAYVAGHRMLLGDYQPYAFKTEDFGRTWTSITNGIPEGDFALTIREDVVQPGLLYLGTEKRVWVSFDNGTSWRSLQQDMPIVQVSDIASTREDIAIATHGRSFYIMYDVAPLRALAKTNGQVAPVALFPPNPAERAVERGASIYYYLAQPADTVTLEFLDEQGNVIRTFTGTAGDTASAGQQGGGFRFGGGSARPETKAGLNRFTWDMRYPGFTDFEGMIMWAAGNRGPVAVPGTYRVRLTANGQTQTQPFEIRMDPRLQGEVTLADLRERHDLAMQVLQRVSEANEAVILSRDVKAQVDDRLAKTDVAQIETVGERVKTKMSDVEGRIYQVRNQSSQDPLNYPIMLNNKLAALLGLIERGEYKPTDQMYEVFESLSGRLDTELNALNLIIATDLAELNRLLEANGLEQVRAEQKGQITT